MENEYYQVHIEPAPIYLIEPRDYEILRRAMREELDCPWGCEAPLNGEMYSDVKDEQQETGVRLWCWTCSFVER